MCEKLQKALDAANKNNTDTAERINAMPIPCDFKGVFMHMADERGFRFNKNTLEMMEIIGQTKSEVCLMILQGNAKQAGLITAYRLATELDNDKDRASVIEWIYEEVQKTTIDEKNVLLGILTVKGKMSNG